MRRTLKKYDDFDVIRVFLAVGEAGLIKRMDVCYRTLIGEGSVKSILGDLADKGVIEIEKKGNRLTESGREEFENIRTHLSDIVPIRSNVFNDNRRAYSAVLKKYDSEKASHIYRARDHAIRIGCWSAMILLFDNGAFRIPSLGTQEYGDLKNELNAENGDLVIIVSSNNRRDGEKGILAVASYLNEPLNGSLSALAESGL